MSMKGKDSSGHESVLSSEGSRSPLIVPGDVEHIAALAMAAGLNVLPSALRTSFIHQLSQAIGTIWHKMNRATVRRVRHHLQCLFNYQEADPRLESLVRDQLVLTSWNALIINLLPSLHDKHLTNLLRIEGMHHLDKLRKEDKVVLLLGAHYGAYGYAVAAALSLHGYPAWLVGYGGTRSEPPGTSYLYRKLYWPRVQRLNRRIRMTTIDPGNKSQPELVKILERKTDIVYLLADQYFVVRPGQDHSSGLVPLHLLDRTVYLDVSGVQLAKQMGAQPLTAIAVRDGYRQRVVIEPLEWASSGTATGDIARDLQVYLTRLEQHLLEYPALWRDLRRSDLLSRLGVFGSEGSAVREIDTASIAEKATS
jgi:lauroyl/myristoyl acyltransferase